MIHVLQRLLVAFVLCSMFLVLATPVFAASSPKTGSTLPHSHTATQVSSVVKPWVPPPPEGCVTLAQRGSTWHDDDTNEDFVCGCIRTWRDTPEGRALVYSCNWRLVIPQPNPSTWENYNSGLFMSVEGAFQYNGARILQWSFYNGGNQWWNMRGSTYGNEYLNALNVYSNRCLGVLNGSTSEGAEVIQWGCNGNADQSWTWTWTGLTSNGWPVFNIINANSHMCLGISSGSIRVGAYAVQWDCNGSPDQLWF